VFEDIEKDLRKSVCEALKSYNEIIDIDEIEERGTLNKGDKFFHISEPSLSIAENHSSTRDELDYVLSLGVFNGDTPINARKSLWQALDDAYRVRIDLIRKSDKKDFISEFVNDIRVISLSKSGIKLNTGRVILSLNIKVKISSFYN